MSPREKIDTIKNMIDTVIFTEQLIGIDRYQMIRKILGAYEEYISKPENVKIGWATEKLLRMLTVKIMFNKLELRKKKLKTII